MQCKLTVGQHVVCVNDQNYLLEDDETGQKLIKGKVYTISEIEADYWSGEIAVQVSEHPWMIEKQGYYIHTRFKPLDRLKVEDFVKEEEPA